MEDKIIKILLPVIIAVAFCSNSMASIVVHTADFIPDSQRSGFNGFEGMPDGALNEPYWEHDSIVVEQIYGQGNEIWTTCSQCGIEGTHSWYPNGGDYGHTQISSINPFNYESVGFRIGQGGSPGFFQYELLSNSSPVLQGAFESTYEGWVDNTMLYLGFSGGGFDTILIRHVYGNPPIDFNSTSYNTLSIDSIEISSIPLPPTFYFYLSGLALFMIAKLKKKIVI